MIRIYISPSCQSCRKVIKWFDEQQIPYISKNIFGMALTEKELKDILSKTENGTEDIISPRSKILKDSKIDLSTITVLELVKFIQENPSILKRPIIVDDNRIQVGYNEDEITTFIPFAKRLASLSCNNDKCDKYDSCSHVKDKS